MKKKTNRTPVRDPMARIIKPSFGDGDGDDDDSMDGTRLVLPNYPLAERDYVMFPGLIAEQVPAIPSLQFVKPDAVIPGLLAPTATMKGGEKGGEKQKHKEAKEGKGKRPC